MAHIEMTYDGNHYTTTGIEAETLLSRILQASTTGTLFWLAVNQGDGLPRPTKLLINSSSQVALSEVSPAS